MNNYGNHVGNVAPGSTVTQTSHNGMSTMTINGKHYTGRNITYSKGRVIVDGRDMTDEPGSPAPANNSRRMIIGNHAGSTANHSGQAAAHKEAARKMKEAGRKMKEEAKKLKNRFK